ncbi:NAD(P)-binding protein [Amylostereum chailletii]|nr:NAD(P)-binding protein [Amylostereum chailletii]
MSSVFYIGATGYIGGSLLVELVKRYPDWKITALLRSDKHADTIRALGLSLVMGSFEDHALVTEQSRMADLVINTADSDNVAFNAAILAGMKQRFEEGKPKGTLIHTSGCAVCLDKKTDGKVDPQGRVWNDINVDDIKAITPEMMHGQVDVPILKAGEEGYLNAYILCPGGIVGTNKGPVKSARSFFTRFLAQLFSQLGGVYIGEGTSEFLFVHIDDLVDLYLRVIDIAVEGKDSGASPYERYYYVTANGVAWKEIAGSIAGELQRRGVLKDGTPKAVKLVDLNNPLLAFVAMDEHMVAGRGNALGWKPRHVELKDYMEDGLDEI